MAENSYTVNDVLHFLDIGLPEEDDSDDEFDGYIDEEVAEEEDAEEEDAEEEAAEEDAEEEVEDEEATSEEDDELEKMDEDGSDKSQNTSMHNKLNTQ